jgi:hypothetical protein
MINDIGDPLWIAGESSMQVLCKASNNASDIRCKVCGQGFLVYWTRSSLAERAADRSGIEQALRAQHATTDDASAHPTSGFNLPEWDGDVSSSAAALLGNAPAWAAA